MNSGGCRKIHTSARMPPDRVGEPEGIPIRHQGGDQGPKSAEMLRVAVMSAVTFRGSGLHSCIRCRLSENIRCFWVFASSRPLFRALERIPIAWAGYLRLDNSG